MTRGTRSRRAKGAMRWAASSTAWTTSYLPKARRAVASATKGTSRAILAKEAPAFTRPTGRFRLRR